MGIDIIWLEAEWESLSRSYRGAADFSALEAAEASETWLRPWVIHEDVDSVLASWNFLFSLTDNMHPELHDALVAGFPVLQKVGILWDAESLAPAMILDLPLDDAEYLLGALHPQHVQEYSNALRTLDRRHLKNLLDEFDFGEDEESVFPSSTDFVDFVVRFSKGLTAAADRGAGVIVLCYG